MVSKNDDGTYTAEVDENSYSFSLWPASKSVESFADLSSIAGDFATALGKVLVDAKDASGTVNADLVGSAVAALVKGIAQDPKKTLVLVRRLTSEGVTCDGSSFVFDTHFKGRIMHMMKVVRAGLQVQYADFFFAFKNLKVQEPKGIDSASKT